MDDRQNGSGDANERSVSLPLWRDHAFLLFWLGRNISLTGTAVTGVVLPILVYRLTGSPLLTAGLVGLDVIPYLVFGLVAGAIADRVNRRRLMVSCDLINALLLGSIPLAAVFHALTIAQIYAVGLLAATAAVWFDAANFGALPALVGKKRLIAANSALSSASTIVSIVGPALGGALASLLGAAQSISVDAISYVLSACSLLLISRALSVARSDDADAGASSASLVRRTARDIGEGLRFLWSQPLVRTMTLLGFGNSLTGGAVIGLLVVYGVQALGLSSRDARLGLLFSAGAVGSFIASLLLPRLARQYPPGWLTLAGLSLSMLALIGLTITSAYWEGMALLVIWEGSYTLTIIIGISLRQMVTPDALQSRVNASARMIAWGGTPFGVALGGTLAQGAGVRGAYLVMALGVGALIAIGGFSPLRKRSLPTRAS